MNRKSHTFIENSLLPRCEIRWIYLVLRVCSQTCLVAIMSSWMKNTDITCLFSFIPEYHKPTGAKWVEVVKDSRVMCQEGGKEDLETWQITHVLRTKAFFFCSHVHALWDQYNLRPLLNIKKSLNANATEWQPKWSAELIKRQPECKIFHFTCQSICLGGIDLSVS